MSLSELNRGFIQWQRDYFGEGFVPTPDGVTVMNAHEKLNVIQVAQAVDLIVFALDLPNGGNLYKLNEAYLLDPEK